MNPPSSQRSRLLGWAGLAAIALLAALHTVAIRQGVDFAIYHLSGARILAGEPLYRLDDSMAWKYTPPAAFFFAPLSLLPMRVAYFLFALATVIGFFRVARWALAKSQAPRAAHWVLLCLAPHILQVLSYGQVEGLLLWLMVESEELAERRPVVSGLIWAAACLLKPPYLVFALAALAFRQWRRIGALAAGTSLGLVLSVLRYGGFSEWTAFRAHHHATVPEMLCGPSNQSVFALVCAFVTPRESASFLPAVALLAAAVLGLFAFAVMRQPEPQRARFLATGGSLYLVAFLSPLGWWTNLVGTLPLLYLLAVQLHRPTTIIYGAWTRWCSTGTTTAWRRWWSPAPPRRSA